MKISELFEFFPEEGNDLKVDLVEVKKMSEGLYSLFIDCSHKGIEITYGGEHGEKGCFSSMYLSSIDSSKIGSELRVAERDVYFFVNREKNQLHILAILGRDGFEKTLDDMERIYVDA